MTQKLLLISVLISLIAVPFFAARDKSPRRGLQKALLLTVLFNLIYLFCIRFIYPRL